MTVNELIEHLKTVKPEHRNLEVRLWLPGSQLTIDGTPMVRQPNPLNSVPVVLLEGNLVTGSALEEIAFSR